jgi:hypothetical protein
MWHHFSGTGATAWHHAGMTMPDPQTCEVKIAGAWRAVTLGEAAVDHVMAVKRCPACHGRMIINGAYSGPGLRRTMSPGGSPRSGGAVIQSQPNTTGNDPDLVISRGATGAETATTNSAAGGNASHPERAVPNGSAGSGGQGGG